MRSDPKRAGASSLITAHFPKSALSLLDIDRSLRHFQILHLLIRSMTEGSPEWQSGDDESKISENQACHHKVSRADQMG
jgi:hypothetical protein